MQPASDELTAREANRFAGTTRAAVVVALVATAVALWSLLRMNVPDTRRVTRTAIPLPIVMLEDDEPAPPVTQLILVQNFAEELKRSVPTN